MTRYFVSVKVPGEIETVSKVAIDSDMTPTQVGKYERQCQSGMIGAQPSKMAWAVYADWRDAEPIAKSANWQ